MADESTTHDWANGASGYMYDPANYIDGTAFNPGDTLIVDGGTTNAVGVVPAGSDVGDLSAGTYVYGGTASNGIDFYNIGIPSGASFIDTTSLSTGLTWSLFDIDENDGSISVGASQEPGGLLMVMSAYNSSATPEFINAGSFTVQNGSSATLRPDSVDEILDNTTTGHITVTGNSTFLLSSFFGQIASVPGVTFTNDGLLSVGPGGTFSDQGDLNGAGTVAIAGSASAAAVAAFSNNVANNFTIANGQLDVGNQSVSTELTGSVTFEDANGSLANEGFAKVQDATIYGFRAGDLLKFTTTALFVNSPTLSYDQTTGILNASFGGSGYSFHLAGNYQLSDFSIQDLGLGNYEVATTQAQPCFAAGTLMQTSRGERPVETICEGDELVLADGSIAPVIWTGRRRVSCAAHPDPTSVRPVRITAGAIFDCVPLRDLVVSPDHAVFIDGRLIPAGLLCNGLTVVQEDVEEVRYHHLELERHSIIMAEGLPVESYLDTGNRHSFANAPIVSLVPHLDRHETVDVGPCAALILEGPELEAVRATLIGRAQTMLVPPTATNAAA